MSELLGLFDRDAAEFGERLRRGQRRMVHAERGRREEREQVEVVRPVARVDEVRADANGRGRGPTRSRRRACAGRSRRGRRPGAMSGEVARVIVMPHNTTGIIPCVNRDVRNIYRLSRRSRSGRACRSKKVCSTTVVRVETSARRRISRISSSSAVGDRDPDEQHEAVVAGDRVAGLDLGQRRRAGPGCRTRARGRSGRDRDDRGERQADRLRVDVGGVAADDARPTRAGAPGPARRTPTARSPRPGSSACCARPR